MGSITEIARHAELFTNTGFNLLNLCYAQSEWSQKTFGTDAERGPIGALKHLEKEAREAQENPKDTSEYADCLLLILDASRRAGINVTQLIDAAAQKMIVNMARKWPKPNGDMPVEHEIEKYDLKKIEAAKAERSA